VKIALRPAKMPGHAAQVFKQGLARLLEFLRHELVFFMGALRFVPTRMSMCMTMEFNQAAFLHGLDFAPAKHDAVGVARGDTAFAFGMVGCLGRMRLAR